MATLTITARGQVTFRKKVLEHLGVRFTMLEPGKAGVQLASLYADIKQRQLL